MPDNVWTNIKEKFSDPETQKMLREEVLPRVLAGGLGAGTGYLGSKYLAGIEQEPVNIAAGGAGGLAGLGLYELLRATPTEKPKKLEIEPKAKKRIPDIKPDAKFIAKETLKQAIKSDNIIEDPLLAPLLGSSSYFLSRSVSGEVAKARNALRDKIIAGQTSSPAVKDMLRNKAVFSKYKREKARIDAEIEKLNKQWKNIPAAAVDKWERKISKTRRKSKELSDALEAYKTHAKALKSGDEIRSAKFKSRKKAALFSLKLTLLVSLAQYLWSQSEGLGKNISEHLFSEK